MYTMTTTANITRATGLEVIAEGSSFSDGNRADSHRSHNSLPSHRTAGADSYRGDATRKAPVDSLLIDKRCPHIENNGRIEGHSHRSEANSHRCEDNSHRSEGNSHRSEGNSHRSEGNCHLSEGNSQRSEGNSHRSEGNSHRSEGNSNRSRSTEGVYRPHDPGGRRAYLHSPPVKIKSQYVLHVFAKCVLFNLCLYYN